MKVRVWHPSCFEDLEAVNVRSGRARLLEFSTILPMGPGDLLKINDDGVVTGMALPNAPFLVEVHLTMGVAQSVLDEKVRLWGMATEAQVTTGATIRVQTFSLRWLEDVVRGDPDVEEVIPLRLPKGVP